MSHLDQQVSRLLPLSGQERRRYQLFCRFCGKTVEDDGYLLVCPRHWEPALLTTSYAQQQFTIENALPGFFRYHQWLPLGNDITGLSTVGETHHLSQPGSWPLIWAPPPLAFL